ncbi:hypothetical protein [Sphingobacterium sp. SGL-16]|uniref:hypothetical protein n=1 Tax=Sphingobacterium sp. SGL-16 TaxID=2710883 RepID=UPI0013ECDBE6|nr:hypothetical protein [Sphingobacterium sp. SGL-16]NGM74856.1 hypothetical protein [Sphingobacterium sp. SGL-16]
MKIITKITTPICLLIFLITSCKKDEVSLPLTKTSFVGSFQATETNNNFISENITLFLNHDNTYSMSNPKSLSLPIEKPLYNIVDGSGKYTIENNTITFQDTLTRTLQAMYPYYLSGKYKYHFDGDNLHLEQENSNSGIKYKLELRAHKNFKN